MTDHSRRRFLGGAAALVGLPLLESLLPRRAWAQSAPPPEPRRLFFFYVPNGIHMQNFTPATEGEGFAATPILQPLFDAGLQGELLVASRLDNEAGSAQGDGAGDHARGTGSFLTCAHVLKTAGDGIRNGVSIDQVVAQHLRSQQATRFASLELGLDGGSASGDCDSGYSCAYARNIAWSDATTPVPKETSPRALFDRLFGGLDPSATRAEQEKRRRYRTSVLDHVREEANLLHARVGVSDRRKLDQYLTGVRELETTIAGEESSRVCEPGARPDSSDFRPNTRLLLDLAVKAMECDQTRVVSFMLGNAGSNRVYDFLGIGRGHHEISHHQDDPANFAELTKIGAFEVGEFGYLLQQLKASTGPAGSLLDQTGALFAAEIEDGNSHSHHRLPVLLGGRLGGAIRPGRHVRWADGTPIANLYVSLAQAMGAPVTSFGDDGTGPLDGLA